MTETKVKTICSQDTARKVINAMYSDSNNKRRERNGKPDTLIAKVIKTHNYITAGVYKLFTDDKKALINNKEFRKMRECDMDGKQLKLRREIVCDVLKMYEENKSGVYIQLSEKGLAVLKTIAEGTMDDTTKSFKLSDMFDIQERYKISGDLAR